MKFIKDTTSSTACVYLDLEGLDISKQLPNPSLNIEPLLHFNTDMYNNLKPSATQESFDITFYYPNLFLETLNDDEKLFFASNLVFMHYCIITEINRNNIDLTNRDPDIIRRNDTIMYTLEDKLAHIITSLDSPTTLNLYERLQWFCNEHIKLADLDNIGEMPQHSAEKTFYISDQRILATLFVMCKLFSVIIGAFIYNCKLIDLDRSLIEIHAYTILKNILKNDETRDRLYNKLVNYVTCVLVKTLDANKGMCANNIYNGDTLDITIDKALATLFTRKAIIMNLSQEDSKLMKYVFSNIKAPVQNYNKGGKNKTRIQYRQIPNGGNESRGEENNDSILEVESANTKNTADTDVLITFAVQDIVNRYIHEYSWNRAEIENAIEYYTNFSHVMLNITNSYILGILFGNDLLGAKSIELLTCKDLAALIVVAQMYFITVGYDELVHLLSLTPTTTRKSTNTGAESRLMSIYRSNAAYSRCAERFIYDVGEISWHTSLDELISTIVTNKYNINTANVIWGAMDLEPHNGVEYFASDNLGELICKLILECTENEEGMGGSILS